MKVVLNIGGRRFNFDNLTEYQDGDVESGKAPYLLMWDVTQAPGVAVTKIPGFTASDVDAALSKAAVLKQTYEQCGESWFYPVRVVEVKHLEPTAVVNA